MRFIIYGAGGIGGSLGARLHLTGRDVVLIARNEHYKAIAKNGLHFVSPAYNISLHIPVVSHPRYVDFQITDVVILCMKSQHTVAALDDLYDFAPDNLPVVCCQNGVANERAALRRSANVYGMVVLVPAEHLRPGEVINFAEEKAGMLDAGRYPSGLDDTIIEVTANIDAAGFSSIPDKYVMRQKYAKLLMNLNNAVQAVTNEGSPELSRQLRSEALACYAAAGIECATVDQTRNRRAEINGGRIEGYERHGGSSLQSVLRGTGNIEADFMNGEIVQLGRLHQVATPANTVVQRIGNRAAREKLPPGSYSIDQVMQLVDSEASKSS